MPEPDPHQVRAQLLSLLSGLCDAIRRRVLQAKRDGQLRRISRTYQVWKSSYHTPGGLSSQASQRTREEWDSAVLHQVVTSCRQEANGLFETAAQCLAELAKLELPETRGHLEQFLFLAARDVARGRGASTRQRLAQRLVDEVTGGELRWRITVWLCAISVDGELSIGRGLVLRAPRSDDFDLEIPSESGWLPWPSMAVPDAILEVERRSKEPPSSEIRKVVNALCLFQVGSVSALSEKQASDSILTSPQPGWPTGRPSAQFTYRVREADRRRLRSFLSSVAPLMPVNPKGVHSDPSTGAQSVGLKQYFRAVHDAADAEERVALGVAALEAILVGNEKDELRYRLALRTGLLLQFAGLNAVEVCSRMKRAYDLRSKSVHGALSTVGRRAEAEVICQMILEYARLSLLKYLEVDRWRDGGKSKDTFLQELDEALLDNVRRRTLRKELSGGHWKLAPPELGPGGGSDPP